jgi:hypothetical protein
VTLLPLEPALSAAKTTIRPGNRHEWEALIAMRQFRLYKITISRRALIGGTSQLPDEIHVQPSATCYALTLGGSRRNAQRKVEQLNGRAGLRVPIARTVEVKPLRPRHLAGSTRAPCLAHGSKYRGAR